MQLSSYDTKTGWLREHQDALVMGSAFDGDTDTSVRHVLLGAQVPLLYDRNAQIRILRTCGSAVMS